MDTFKDKQRFDDMEARGETPWRVWQDGTLPDGKLLIPGVVSHATNVGVPADKVEACRTAA